MIRSIRRAWKRLLKATTAFTKPAPLPAAVTTPQGFAGACPITVEKGKDGRLRISAAAAVAAGAIVSAHVNGGEALEAFSLPPAPEWVKATDRVLDGAPVLALDDMGGLGTDFTQFAYGSYFKEGLGFLGYPYLAELSQRGEYRRAVEILAKEMTRKWIKFTTTGDVDKSEQIKKLEEAFTHFHVKELFKKAAEGDGYSGRHHIFVDTGDNEDPQELARPMIVDPRKYGVGCLKGLRSIEAIWAYPSAFNATRPIEADYYKPHHWFVQADTIHTSRMLTFVSRPMPDILKPAYSFGGLSLTQIMKPYVDNWLDTRQGINDLIQAFSTWVLKTDMAQLMESDGSGADLFNRVDFFTRTANNRGVFAIDKDTEDFANVEKSLSGLDRLQAQAQEHMAAITGIPLVILLGVTPSGLNASSEGELQAFFAWVKDQQEQLFRPNLTVILKLMQLHLFGVIDPEIGFEFEPLWEESAAEAATIEKTKADTDAAYINAGVMAPEEVRQRVANDPDSMYQGVDLSAPPPEPPQEEGEEDDEDEPPGGGGGGNPFDGAKDAQPAFKEADHPRDEAGRFAQAAGGAGGVKQAHSDFARAQRPIPAEHFNAGHYAGEHDQHDVTAESIISGYAPEVATHLHDTGVKALNAEPTHKTHRISGEGAGAVYKDARREIQRKVLMEPFTDKEGKTHPPILSPEKIAAATPPPGQKPVFTILGGRGGSGKSKFKNLVYDPARTLVLDADEIKQRMPEYEGWNANQVHEESSDLLEQALADARALGVNVVLDGTLKSLGPALKKIEQFQGAGYETEAHYMHLPRQEAAKRAIGRFMTDKNDYSGRFVPPQVVLSNVDNERNFDELRKLVDRWSFHDNHNVDKDAPPRLISQGSKAGT